MPVIFEASAKSSVATKSMHLLIAVIVGVALSVAAWMMDGIFFRGIVILLVMVCAVMTKSVASDLIAYANAERGWRVEIDNFTLSWQSPVDKLFRSFKVKLSEIESLRFVQVRSSGTKSRSSRRVFFIHLKDGRTMEIPPQEGGIWVNDVFEALEKKGIRYHRENVRKEKFGKEKKQLDIIPMEAWQQ